MFFYFALSVFTCFLVLYFPGYLGLKICKTNWRKTLIMAPLVSIAVFELLAIIFGLVNFPVTVVVFLIAAIVVSCFAGIVLRVFNHEPNEDSSIYHSLVAFLIAAISASVALFLFFRPLRYGTLIAGFDSVFHVNLVRVFTDTHLYSPLKVSLYSSSKIHPISGDGFYPAAWHLICSFVLQLSHAKETVVINAVNFVFVSIVFVFGQIGLYKSLFKTGKESRIICLFMPLNFIAFPWVLLARGEQFPQFAAFACLPSACYAVHQLIQSKKINKIFHIILTLASVLTLATLQTNACFSLMVFAAFDIFGFLVRKKHFIKNSRAVTNAVFWIGFCVIWILLFLAPPLRSISDFNWSSTYSIQQAFINWLTLSFTGLNCAQILLSVFVIIGLNRLFSDVNTRWYFYLYIFFGLIYAYCTSFEGLLKHILGGFWYTDPDRLGAQVAIFAYPVAVLGGERVFNFIRSRFFTNVYKSSYFVLNFSFGFLILAICTLPNFFINGFLQVRTAFGALGETVSVYTSDSSNLILDSCEYRFLNDVSRIVGTDSLVLNVPDDGSSFAYGLYGINVLYKRNVPLKKDLKQDAVLRRKLNRYSSDPAVKKSVDKLDAKYLMLLDTDTSSGLFHTFRKSQWKGYYGVSSDTKGFRLVLKMGDCRLYKILD